MQKIIAWIKGLPLWLRAGAVGFIIGAIVCTGIVGYNTRNDLRALRERQEAVDANIAEFIRQSNDSTAKLDSLGKSIARVSSEVSNTTSAIRQLDGSVKNVAGSVGTIVARIGRIEERQSAFDAKLNNFTSDFAGLADQISSLGDSLGSIGVGLQSASDSLSGANIDIDAAAIILQGLPKISPKPENEKPNP